MIRHGQAPFLECSSKGDKRFSAFCARIRARNNRSIEELYQGAKIFEDGRTGLGWREAKGKRAINMDDVLALYSRLWDEYIEENPELLELLKEVAGLSDLFGQAGHACQATELWRIRNETLALEDARELWTERAAIMEIDGGLDARQARLEAMKEVIARHGKPVAQKLAAALSADNNSCNSPGTRRPLAPA